MGRMTGLEPMRGFENSVFIGLFAYIMPFTTIHWA